MTDTIFGEIILTYTLCYLGGAGFMAYTAASHQGAVELI